MLGIDRRVLSAAWTLFLFVLVLVCLYEISHTLVIFALALFMSNLLSPVVEMVQRGFPGECRGRSRWQWCIWFCWESWRPPRF